MKKFILCFTLLCVAQAGFANSMVLDNATNYPLQAKNSKIAIQWAANVQDMQAENKAIIYGLDLNTQSLHLLNQSGKVNLDIPKNAQYFRILVWSKGKKEPDLLTNWVSIEHNKSYTINQEQLVPAVLVSGIGC